MQKLTVPQLLIMHITDKLSLCESSAPRPPSKVIIQPIIYGYYDFTSAYSTAQYNLISLD